MIRAALVLLAFALVVVALAAAAGQPGTASFTWLGWRVETTAAAAVLLVVFGALVFTLLWRAILFIVEAPRRVARERLEARRVQGAETLARGFLAAAAGDGSEARRLAQKAAALADDSPALARILAAQAAEAAGDATAAQAAYSAMLGFPDMRLAAHRGLMQTALAQGDKPGALRHAEAAFGLSRSARWAWRALLEARLEDGDWNAALELVETALDRKTASPVVAQRARAALLAASAASLEHSADAKQRAQALDFACLSAKLQPDFAPGVVMAARLLHGAGKTGRARSLIEAAWKGAPHPALWLAWRDLDVSETPGARAKRLAALAALNPDHLESRMLIVEAALVVRDTAAAQTAAQTLCQSAPSAREAALMARIAYLEGRADEARVWVARARAAPVDPDWSDLDPEGRAFAYTPTDWARLVSTYAENGELAHPRMERRERVITDLPDLPGGYHASPAVLAAAQTSDGLLHAPDDPGAEAAPHADAPALAPRAQPARRPRLATRPRPAK